MATTADKILIPLGAAVTSIGGAAFWLATLSARVSAAEKQMNDYHAFFRDVVDIARSIEERVSRIEGKLDGLKGR